MSSRLHTFLFLILPLVFGGMLHTVSAQEDNGTTVRVFRIKYAEPVDISAAIQPLLSEKGSITVQPAKRRITVRDQSSRMSRISSLVADMDVSPEFFRIQVTLLHGTSKGGSGDYQAPARVEKMYPFTSYRKLGGAELQGQTGDTVSVDLDDGYRLIMTVLDHRREDSPFGLPTRSLRLDLRPVILQRKLDNPKPHQILKTRVMISENQEVSIGAGVSEEAEDGLVLILKALTSEKP